MAADLQPEWICGLPRSWSYGLTRDGRVFFVNEEAKSTTWLHPLSGEAVITGHRKTPDLPTGWEEGYTFEGARCFIKATVGTASVQDRSGPQGCTELCFPYCLLCFSVVNLNSDRNSVNPRYSQALGTKTRYESDICSSAQKESS
ncbi:pleckstrin homology domain-containing family A member 5-like isoform X10 [Phyllopteryx taeniolatus]|uniref:pleckstrin homology domain-containing family A member 5-like isoform X10 n=1 Tax=Phyllopteryx taeniolatus TaxID=161469 RepID=UPI002AD4889F|nr:pleckstrin homology domain-containing family A member 5-like isoform X10 [Phyllopteryx taeniolatus]